MLLLMSMLLLQQLPWMRFLLLLVTMPWFLLLLNRACLFGGIHCGVCWRFSAGSGPVGVGRFCGTVVEPSDVKQRRRV
jgi:hypothetical protein